MPNLFYYDENSEKFKTYELEKDALIPLTQNVKSTATEYIALWDALADSGYCVKTKIAEVKGIPINKYVFAFGKDTLYGDDLTSVSDGSFYSKPKISIISGQHGDEKGSPLYLYEFMHRACTNSDYFKYFGMFDFHVIPLVNPTGYNANTRNNYQNKNTNRDGTSAPETVEGRALKEHFDSYEWAACFDIHQMSKDHGLSNFNWSCGYLAMQYGANSELLDKYNNLFLTVGYETERLMEQEYNKEHRQMFQPWDWGVDYNSWMNYPVRHNKTNLSFTPETAQTWAYYSDSGVDLNQVALIGGNTITDKTLRAFLDNI